MWRLGFFFHEMAFSLLSIFLPLYLLLIDKGNALFDVGVIIAIALFAAIPASFLWGYLCDKTRHYKRYILIALLGSTVMIYLFTFTTDVFLLIVLYAVMSIFHVAHEAPKNVLISELYSHKDWERNFAFYEGLTEAGSLIGLVVGFFASYYTLGAANTLYLVAGLNFVAFVLAVIFVVDPPMIFERSLVSIEKTVDFASHGVFVASKMIDGISLNEKLKRENVTAFCGGLVLFSLATSILFTPMPVFVNSIAPAEIAQAVVFAVFMLSSSGAIAGYVLAGRRSQESTGKAPVAGLVLFRSVFAFVLLATVSVSSSSVLLATGTLVVMGFLFAVIMVRILALSMELIPAGKAGLINVLIGLGGAFGSFIGPFIAQVSGFLQVFVVAGAIFFAAFVFFKIFA
ncbi:MAG TPA: MFS transporter [candidate division Zixibacteria bacterium]|nr:MFS transporter [candidate division Zixibacteria bacterium]